MSIMKKNVIKYLIMFGFLLLFFTKICPIVPFVGDDWYFVGSMRQPIPYSGIFNPSKIFPEILQALCGYIGAYIIYPLTHDYVGSLALSAAIIVSLFIALLCYLFNSFLVKRLNINFKKSTIYESLFLIIFFILFKRENGNSYYGFWSVNFTCYFNYIIPGIINACIVLYMMSFKNFQEKFEKSSYLYKGFFAICIYFAIFSSIQFNIILASYALVSIFELAIEKFKKNYKKMDKIKCIIKKSWVFLLIIVLWLIAIYYDSTGLRGKMLKHTNWFTVDNFIKTINNLKALYILCYKPLIVIFMLGLISLIIYSIKNKTIKKFRYAILTGSLLIINTLYLIVLYMKADSGYASRVDATWAIIFYLVLFIMLIIIMCNKIFKFTEIFIPIFVVIFGIAGFNMNYPFEQSVYDAVEAKQIDNYIINQIVEADKAGHCFVNVKVPKNDSDTNWPQPYNMALWLQNTLYSHKIIRTRMRIEFIPDKKLNKKLYKKNYSSVPYIDFERSKYLK